MSIIADLKAQIAALQQRIDAIQADCSHPASALTKVPKRGPGDGFNDHFYNECHCGLCDRRWHEDQ